MYRYDSNKIMYITPLDYSTEYRENDEFYDSDMKAQLNKIDSDLRQLMALEQRPGIETKWITAKYGLLCLQIYGIITKYVNMYGYADAVMSMLVSLARAALDRSDLLLQHHNVHLLTLKQLKVTFDAITEAKKTGRVVSDADIERLMATSDTDATSDRMSDPMVQSKFRDLMNTPPTSTRFEDIVGTSYVIKMLRYNVVLAGIDDNFVASDSMKGLILFGMPGTGKTVLVEAYANQSESALVVLTPSKMSSPYIGVTENALSLVFEASRKRKTVIFIDEIDLLLANRNNDNGGSVPAHVSYLQSQIMQETSKSGDQNKNIYFIAATNNIGDVDPAILSRLQTPIFIPLPDKSTRQTIIERQFLKHHIPIDIVDLNFLAQFTKFYSGRDINTYLNHIFNLILIKMFDPNTIFMAEQTARFYKSTDTPDSSPLSSQSLYLVPADISGSQNSAAGATNIQTIGGDCREDQLVANQLYSLDVSVRQNCRLLGIPKFRRGYLDEIQFKPSANAIQYRQFIANNYAFVANPGENLENVQQRLDLELDN